MPSARGDVDRAALRQVELLRPRPRSAARRQQQQRRPAATGDGATVTFCRPVQHQLGRAGELDRRRPCRSARSPARPACRTAPRHAPAAAPAAAPFFRSIDALCVSAASCRRRGTASRRSTGRAGWRAAMNTPCLRLHHQPGAVLQRHIALRAASGRPLRPVLRGGGGGQRVGPALLVDAVVARVGHLRRRRRRRPAGAAPCAPSLSARSSSGHSAIDGQQRQRRPPAAGTWSAVISSAGGAPARRRRPARARMPPVADAARGASARRRRQRRTAASSAHATPARSRSCMCRMPTGRPAASTTNSAVIGRAARVHHVQRLGGQRVGADGARRGGHDLADRAAPAGPAPWRGAGRRR